MQRFGQRKWEVYKRRKMEEMTPINPLQVKCEVCGCRSFYLMAQPNGSIESYCAVHNHKRELVNIPDLVSHVDKGYQDDRDILLDLTSALTSFVQRKGLLDEFNKGRKAAVSEGG
jgi:hypothetical protein